ncbi:hypothetical protein [Chitinophaga tropicalis]|uniref:Cytochrome c domain-containing protein n=1 Tax=Chitinophaga tropicalis TaxID=2683588 RepID=A0A7K1TX61_9BACT|nr:hypothetical protein [Chitinophaga tropicalis]MVT06687.1 hypothetical protein [Chitinophaga tropicalis]
MRTSLLPVLLMLLVYGCTAEQAPAPDPGVQPTACDTSKITSAYIMTTVGANCTNGRCHKGTGNFVVSDFSTLEKLKTYLSANTALFRERVTGPNADMPPRGKLSQGMRDSIDCWISKGMPE